MMHSISNKSTAELSKPIDYLVIGHLTCDIGETSNQLGGTATFSGLTAQSLGMNVGIITAASPELDTSSIKSLWTKIKISPQTTTFKNISNGLMRTQYLFQVADKITGDDLPEFIQPPKIVHLGPMADEVDPTITLQFPNSLKCLTPQGWLRKRDKNNVVKLKQWKDFDYHLSQADIAVISIDDVQKDEDTILKMASSIPIFCVTEGFKGARLYWNNDVRFISAPEVKYVDDTGSGDIFAAAFFCRYFNTKNPWEAGRFAVQLASWSVERKHLNSIPTEDEIRRAKMEVIP